MSRVGWVSLVLLASACTGEMGDGRPSPGAPRDGGAIAEPDGGTTAADAGTLPSGDAGQTPIDEPDCAGVDGARCFYVAPDGDDAAAGDIDHPFRTFRAALVLARPGDFVYARGGTYGRDNAMVAGVERLGAPSGSACPDGQTLADGACFRDVYAFIALGNQSGWATAAEPYTMASGEEGRPITVRSFPRERAVLDCTDLCSRAVQVAHTISHFTIQGFEMNRGYVNIGGGDADSAPHHIVIRDNEIHHVTLHVGDNNGLVRIDRGDVGGPYEITIEGNVLHDLYPDDTAGDWHSSSDTQHFAAVTTLSRETYLGYDGGGTGRIVIRGNTIYQTPQAFFFKNPMAGPIEIEGNVIHDVVSIGIMSASNVTMTGNVVYGTRRGFWSVGGDGYDDPRVEGIAGQNAVITHNTFVGLDSLLGVRSGTGHTISNNVFFGMDSAAAGANWDTPAYLEKSEIYTDAIDPAESLLQEITSDDNCFITPRAGFQFVSRKVRLSPGGEVRLDHWDHAEAQAIFGFDARSRFHVETDPAAVFVDPAAGDYRLRDASTCPAMGADAAPR